MRAFVFKREAKWLLLLGLIPTIGILLAIVWPAIARWLAGR